MTGVPDVGVFGRLVGRNHHRTAHLCEQLGTVEDGVVSPKYVEKGLGERRMASRKHHPEMAVQGEPYRRRPLSASYEGLAGGPQDQAAPGSRRPAVGCPPGRVNGPERVRKTSHAAARRAPLIGPQLGRNRPWIQSIGLRHPVHCYGLGFLPLSATESV